MREGRNSQIYKWMRVLHRDIGFFAIGLTVIYCISGIILTYRETDFLKSETRIEKTVAPDLTANQLGRVLHLKDMKIVSEDEQEIRFTNGTYLKKSGLASYTANDLPWLLRKFNSLHFVSSKDSRHWFTALYAGALLFLALSSFWMYRPGTKYFKRGMITAGSGVLASIVLLSF